MLVIFGTHSETAKQTALGDDLLSTEEFSSQLSTIVGRVNVNNMTNECDGGVLVNEESMRESQGNATCRQQIPQEIGACIRPKIGHCLSRAETQ